MGGCRLGVGLDYREWGSNEFTDISNVYNWKGEGVGCVMRIFCITVCIQVVDRKDTQGLVA